MNNAEDEQVQWQISGGRTEKMCFQGS